MIPYRTLDDIQDAEYLTIMFNTDAPKEELYIAVSEFLIALNNDEYNGDLSWNFRRCSGQAFKDVIHTVQERIGYDPLGTIVIGIDWMTQEDETYLWGTYLTESIQYITDETEENPNNPYALRALKPI